MNIDEVVRERGSEGCDEKGRACMSAVKQSHYTDTDTDIRTVVSESVRQVWVGRHLYNTDQLCGIFLFPGDFSIFHHRISSSLIIFFGRCD